MQPGAAALLFTLLGQEPLHPSDYAVKLGATFFQVGEEANPLSQQGQYEKAAAKWEEMIAAEEPGVPKEAREQIFKPAKAAAAALRQRATLASSTRPEDARALFRELIRPHEFVEHAELGDARLSALVAKLLTIDPVTAKLLRQPFQVLVESKDLSEPEKKALLEQTVEALQKTGLKAESKAPMQAEKRVLTLVTHRGPVKPPSAELHHPGAKLPPNAKSCGVEIEGRLDEGKTSLLKVELGARSVFGTEDQCLKGPPRMAAELAPFKLLEAAMPRPR